MLVKSAGAVYRTAEFPFSGLELRSSGEEVARLVIMELAMAVPKRKTSPSKRGMRRSTDALKAPTYVEDRDSGELRRPHHIDLKTGMYRGRQVLEPKEK